MTAANFPPQKALATTKDAAVFAVRHDVTNTRTIVSCAQNDVVDTPAIVSDNHRNTLKSPEDTRGQNWIVSIIRASPVAER
jgi:hypothetical protein